ncbi:Hypothetical predicted protein, partial [Paramuricea clavata]
IHAGLDKGQCSARVFFADFKMGFDLVDHNVIITDFERLGVHPVIIRWIKSFLTDREQCVKIGDFPSISSIVQCLHEVPPCRGTSCKDCPILV